MTLYLDDFHHPHTANNGNVSHWSWLVTDDPTVGELHQLAHHLNLPRGWFTTDGLNPGLYRPHYLIPENARAAVLAAGAHPISCQETESVFLRARDAATRNGITYGPRA